MSATLNTFSIDQIRHAIYNIQTQTYTWGPGTLATGETKVFEIFNWNSNDDIDKVVTIEALAATQSAGVQVYWTADRLISDRAQGWTSGFPAGLRWYPTRAVAGEHIALYVNNTSGAVVNNFQFNYVVSVVSFNLFQRMLNGFAKTSDDLANIATQAKKESDIAAKIKKYTSMGYRPFAFSTTLANVFESQRLSDPRDTVPFKLTIPTGATTTSQPKTISVPNAGNIPAVVYILRGISLEGAPAGLNITIDRDSDPELINELNAPAWVQADEHPWPFFVPAKKSYKVNANGNAGDYYIRLDIEKYRASQLLLAHLGMVPMTSVDLGLQ